MHNTDSLAMADQLATREGATCQPQSSGLFDPLLLDSQQKCSL
jgi:hypothetical protein